MVDWFQKAENIFHWIRRLVYTSYHSRGGEHMKHLSFKGCCLAAVGFVFLLGCGSGQAGGKLAISGTVKLKGQPLESGTITFSSADPQQQQMTGGQIKNGQFSIPAEQGLPPGKYRVRISSPVGGPTVKPDEAPGETPTVAQDRIPPEWGSKSNQQVEIKAGQKNHFTFEIP